MAKYDRTVLTRLTLDAVNLELKKIQDAIIDHLDRKEIDGNQMQTLLDMNSNQVNNMKEGSSGRDAINLNQLNTSQEFLQGQIDELVIDFTQPGTRLPPHSIHAGSYLHTNGVSNLWKQIDTAEVHYSSSGAGAVTRPLNDKLDDVISVKDFGAVGDGNADDTLAIQNALDACGAAGGGVCFFPSGTYLGSIHTSPHPHAVWLVPANVTVRGVGAFNTCLTRPAAERGDSAILMVNKNYDNLLSYTADGGIVIEDLQFKEGALTPIKSQGALLGIGGSDSVVVRNCKFKDNDQPAIDIVQSKNISVIGCIFETEVNSVSSYSIRLSAGAVLPGILAQGLATTEITIENNLVINDFADNSLLLGDSNNNLKNSLIRNNIISGPIQGDKNAIGSAFDTSFENCQISNNRLIMRHRNTRCIIFFIDSDNDISGLRIHDNHIEGRARLGIWVGTDNSEALTNFKNQRGLKIYGNYIRLAAEDAHSFLGCVIAWGMNQCEISSNVLTLDRPDPTTTEDAVIRVENARTITIHDNFIEVTSNTSPSLTMAGIRVTQNYLELNSIPSYTSIKNNFIETDPNIIDYHINFEPKNTPTPEFVKGVVSNNHFIGTPAMAHLRTQVGISDGTNNLQLVDFGASGDPSDSTILPITTSQYSQNLSIPESLAALATKAAVKPNFRVMFAEDAIGDFLIDSAQMATGMINQNKAVGIQIRDVDLIAGTFSIITGDSGVSMGINTNNNRPDIITSGFIKIWVGI